MCENETISVGLVKSYANTLLDPSPKKDEVKIRALHELYENIEKFSDFVEYADLLDYILNIFMNYLKDGQPLFISELPQQRIRKSILEIINRLPINLFLKPYHERILSLMFKLFEIDNEENVLICIRVIIEYYKFFKPHVDNDVLSFLQMFKKIFINLKSLFPIIIDSNSKLTINSITELDVNAVLNETFVSLEITTAEQKDNSENGPMTYNLKPKAIFSLKVLQEVPILIIIIMQYLKGNLSDTSIEYIPLVLQTISLRPTIEQKSSPKFNESVYAEFMAVQIKSLSFLAFVLKDNLEIVSKHHVLLIESIIGIISGCPIELSTIRRELLIAIKHIFLTPLKSAFVPYIQKLFDESILLNRGWTVNETLRSLAFQTLADLTHHIRDQLSIDDYKAALNLFFRNIQDDTLAISIQIVSCKVVLNIIDYIKAPIIDPNINERIDLLTRILECFIIRLKNFYKNTMSDLVLRYKSDTGERPEPEIRSELLTKAIRYGFPFNTPLNTLHDYKAMVKIMITGVKTVTWGLLYCKNAKTGDKSEILISSVPLQTTEVKLLSRLLKWGLYAMNMYSLFSVNFIQRTTVAQKSMEEREVIENFATLFIKLHPSNFEEIFRDKIEFLVEQIHLNPAFLLMIRIFLNESNVSNIFSKILMKYLLKHIKEIGCNHEKSDLYTQLFKTIFNYVSVPNDGTDDLLKPDLSQILTQSMQHALLSKDPFPYLIMLRALFRSIGGGVHDLLYVEFLPLLPGLLETLNRLQSGTYRLNMKEVLIELCLTIPVRLSSLLPYIPLLVDPLVTALNGSDAVICQGLRTLELCVNNLQPYFLYEHIQPIKADLMLALWKLIRNTDDNSLVAFRLLGKLGGNNRRVLTEPQPLEYVDAEQSPTTFYMEFEENTSEISVTIDPIISAVWDKVTSTSATDMDRENCWNIVFVFLSAAMNLNDKDNFLINFFNNSFFTDNKIVWIKEQNLTKHSNKYFRETHLKALETLLFLADLKPSKILRLRVAAYIVEHYVMISVMQQIATKFEIIDNRLDATVIVDAIANLLLIEVRNICRPGFEVEDMTYFDKNDCMLWKFGYLSLYVMLSTAKMILGSKKRACELPLISYLSEKLCNLCYGRSWISKMAGCIGVQFLYKNMDIDWVFDNLMRFMRAIMFVIVDLIGEITCGTINVAQAVIKDLIVLCISTEFIDSSMPITLNAQKKALHDLTAELVNQLTSPHTILREEAIKGLRLLATKRGISIGDLISPHKDLLADIIPPKKYLLRQQPINVQIGLIEGYTFCASFVPKLFSIDSNVEEHVVFLFELKTICEKDDSYFSKISAYENANDLNDLKRSAFRALATCSNLQKKYADEVFTVLFKNMERCDTELQYIAFQALKDYMEGYKVPTEIVLSTVKKVYNSIENYNESNLVYVKRVIRLFSNAINENFTEKFFAVFKEMVSKEVLLNDVSKVSKEIKEKINSFLEILSEIPSITADQVVNITDLIIKVEKKLMIDVGSPFRQNLVICILRYPLECVNHFFNFLSEISYVNCFTFIINHEKTKPVRESIENPINVQKCINMLTLFKQITNFNLNDQTETRFQTIKIIALVTKHDQQWISEQYNLINVLKDLWYSDDYHDYHQHIENINCRHWEEPRFLAMILMQYFSFHPNDIDLAFQLMRAFCNRLICSFQFLRDFFEKVVSENYTVEWKRTLFVKFVNHFTNGTLPKKSLVKIVQIILIPSFYISLERGDGDKLLNVPFEKDQTILDLCLEKLFDVENPSCNPDHVRIPFLQLASLLLEKGTNHIDNSPNKNCIVGRILTFAWPCLHNDNCVDASNKYYGHLVLAHIAAKFAISKKIVSRIFFGLLKGHVTEARSIVKLALDVLTPLMPTRVDDGYVFIAHWTKKIMVEEGHCGQQLYHILFLIVKHYRIFYPIRHYFIQHLIPAMNKAATGTNSSMENRRLAIDVGEVLVRWETERIRRSNLEHPEPPENEQLVNPTSPILMEQNKPLDQVHVDFIFNFFLRYPCHLVDITKYPANSQPNTDLVVRRAVASFKALMGSDLWTCYNVDLNVNQLEKYLMADSGVYCISLALEVLISLMHVLKKEQIGTLYHTIENGLVNCIYNTNIKIIKWVGSFFAKFLQIFPPENVEFLDKIIKMEEFPILCSELNKFVTDKLIAFVDNKLSIIHIYPALLHLKSILVNYSGPAERLVQLAMKSLTRLVTESFSSENFETIQQNDFIILCLDSIKSRIPDLPTDLRRPLITNIIYALIEKCRDYRILKLIIKMIDEWNKLKKIDKSPTFRERTLLLIRILQTIEDMEEQHMDNVEDADIRVPYFDVIYDIFNDQDLQITDFPKKLETVFLVALRSKIVQIRDKFANLYMSSIPKSLKDRLMFIICSQNWESIGNHYWINQTNEIILSIAKGKKFTLIEPNSMLPSVENLSKNYEDLITFNETDLIEITGYFSESDNIDFMELMTFVENDEIQDRPKHLYKLIKQHSCLTALSSTISYTEFIYSVIYMCHINTELSTKMWLNLFPNIWDNLLTNQCRASLEKEMELFILSGAHNIQQNLPVSALNTFVEAICRCRTTIKLKPDTMRFVGKNHNLWHRMILKLEGASCFSIMKSIDGGDCYEFEPENKIDRDILEVLTDFYLNILEYDLCSAVWQHRARYAETRLAITFQQQGYYEQAKDAYDLSMEKFKNEHKITSPNGEMTRENALWEEQYLYCSRQLCMWEGLMNYSKAFGYHSLFLDSIIRFPDKLATISNVMTPEDFLLAETDWKMTLHLGYIALLSPGSDNITNIIEDLVKNISIMCSRDWCHLPRIVSLAHIPILQAAQLVAEMHESEVIHSMVSKSKANFPEVKEIIKTWQGRLPNISDDLSVWDDLLSWRHIQYIFIADFFSNKDEKSLLTDLCSTPSQEAIVGRHADSQSNILFGKICRKNNNTKLCMDSLEKIYGMEHIPISDCFHKMRQQVKCYLHMSSVSKSKLDIDKALKDISRTKFGYFSDDYKSELFALKAHLLGLKGEHSEANKFFSLAIQLNDSSPKGWALYANYLETKFLSDPKCIEIGINTMAALVNACRNSSETKCKKYISTILWLLSYDDDKCSLMEILRKYGSNINSAHWLIWIPQLLAFLVQYDGDVIMNILVQIGRDYPQAVYYPIRTLYLTLKSEQIERYKNENISECPAIPATAAMLKCSKVMNMLKDAHPVIVLSLEGIGDQVAWLRENWYEEMLRPLKQALAKCYTLAFETCDAVNQAQISPQTLNFVNKLVSLIDHIPSSSTIEGTSQDVNFQKMKQQFKNDFDFTKPNAILLQNLIVKLKKWIKVFEKISNQLMKSFLVEEKSRFLANFNSKTAEVEIPGEFLTPKPISHYVRIVRFMPTIDVIQKHNTIAHRLYIRGHNGKIYPYLVLYDSVSADARREERVLQLLRILNESLAKYKESAKRFLAFSIPKVVSVTPQLRFVEDNPSSLSLLDIFKQRCKFIGLEPDAPIELYYKSLENLQKSGVNITFQLLRDIFIDIQTRMVPATILKEWAIKTYPSAVDFWHFRKTFTVQMSLSSFAEHILHLTRLNPEMIYLHRNTGVVTISYFKFDFDLKRDIEYTRPVSFRLTPNISEFILRLGLDGPFLTTMVATSRCFLNSKYSMVSFFRTIMKDELLSQVQLENNGSDATKNQQSKIEQLTIYINKVLNHLKIRLGKLSSIGLNEKNGKVVNHLTNMATNVENLCRMDPLWHPWL